MKRHERETRSQGGLDSHVHIHGAAARADADALAVLHTDALSILGRDEQRLALSERRRVLVGLNTRVEGVEPATGGQSDRKLFAQAIDRRIVLHGVERSAGALDGMLPEPSVQELRAPMRFVRTGPLDPTELLEPAIRHTRMHRGQAAALIPGLLGGRMAPV